MAKRLLSATTAGHVAALAGLLTAGAGWAAPPVWPASAIDAAQTSVPSSTLTTTWLREKQTRPNFLPPAASHCADTPVLVEVPGPVAEQWPPSRQ